MNRKQASNNHHRMENPSLTPSKVTFHDNRAFVLFLLSCWVALSVIPKAETALSRSKLEKKHGGNAVGKSQSEASTKNHDDFLTAYAWKSNVPIPSHGDLVDPFLALQTLKDELPFEKTLTSSSTMSIDQVHRQGFPHLGVWIFVVDSDERLLITKRGKKLLTCPNSWSLVGEHSSFGEELNPEKTVLRGLTEEISPFLVSKYMKQNFNLMKDKEGKPVYYYRDYGHAMGNRQDKQLTYFWYVELNAPGEKILEDIKRQPPSSLDQDFGEETMEMKWVTVHELEKWIHDRPKDFCHSTIHRFFQIGIRQLRHILGQSSS